MELSLLLTMHTMLLVCSVSPKILIYREVRSQSHRWTPVTNCNSLSRRALSLIYLVARILQRTTSLGVLFPICAVALSPSEVTGTSPVYRLRDVRTAYTRRVYTRRCRREFRFLGALLILLVTRLTCLLRFITCTLSLKVVRLVRFVSRFRSRVVLVPLPTLPL